MCIDRHVEYMLFLSSFNETLIPWTIFLKNTQISNFMTVHWEPSCSIWMDGQTDRHDRANSHFTQFCEHA